jgi:hypothetical protein
MSNKFQVEGIIFEYEEGTAASYDYYYNDAVLSFSVVFGEKIIEVSRSVLNFNTQAYRIFRLGINASFETENRQVLRFAVEHAREKRWEGLNDLLKDFYRRE